MYLNIGGNISLRMREIVGIFDLDNSTYSKITREFLNKAEKEKKTVTIAREELPKSFIITKNQRIYLSPVTSATLLKRAESGEMQ